jgi:hypothetical protein
VIDMLSPDEILARIDAIPMPVGKERDYIGASEIGHKCTRYLWLRFHRYFTSPPFPARMLRLFQRGNDEEIKFQNMLAAIGFQVLDNCWDQTGFSLGFFKGHSDGVLLLDDHRFVAEYKTHSKKWFDTLQVGTLSQTFPKHYAQAQTYMHNFKASHAVYLAVCKDDDRLFCDVIEYNEKDYLTYQAKAEYIATSDKPPERIASKPTAFDCKFCDAHAVCWGLEMPRVACQNCTSSNKDHIAGVFGCDLKKPWIGTKLEPCEHHSYNPYALQDFLGWEPIEFFPKERAVKYSLPSGAEIINGAAPFGAPSKEIEIA